MATMTARTMNLAQQSRSLERSSTYSPLSQPSCSPRCLPAVHMRSGRQNARTISQAYRGGNCQDNFRRGGFNFGPFMMGPQDAAMAGAALADMARKFQEGNSNFGRGMEGMQVPLLVDLIETANDYTLTADVPGLQKSDLKITVNQKDRTLKISGERKRAESDKADNEDQQQKFRRQFERRVGKFQRVFSMIPDAADLSAVSARVDKGVLTISIKKTVTAEVDDTMDIRIE